ncbi:diaminopimelate decarboxylase [Kitasatospora sp. NPDC093806]|uniref:diaminopimelate decarboxylase n=1 Tax=Kitasatospora sp. NPDC093806 TaxID=3155075 RepID=UPI003432F9A5
MFKYGTQDVNADGHLEIGGCDTLELARRYGTPLYVIDEADVRGRSRAYLEAFRAHWPHIDVAYASKAFLVGEIVRLATAEGLSLDVVSAGELRLALWAGADPSRITFHGNYKTHEDIELAVRSRVRSLVVDCLDEIEAIDRQARREGVVQAVDIRLNLGIDIHTDPKYTTGSLESKFGLAVHTGDAAEAVARILGCAGLRLRGLHFHLGAQVVDTKYHRRALHDLGAFVREVQAGAGRSWRPAAVTVGGGMGVNYDGVTTPPTPAEWARDLIPVFLREVVPLCAPDVVFGVEPGRSLVAEAGTTLYTVGPTKHSGARRLVAVDGGLSDNPRPIMYQSVHHAVLASNPELTGAALHESTVFGRHCETDKLIDEVLLPDLAPGEVLAVQCTGAYTHSMFNQHNRFDKPPVVFVEGGRARLVVRRERFEDTILTEIRETDADADADADAGAEVSGPDGGNE